MSKKVYVKPYPKEFREQVVKRGAGAAGGSQRAGGGPGIRDFGGFGTALGVSAAFGASPSVSAKMKTRRPRRDEPPSVTTTNADPSGVRDSVSPSSEGRRILPDHVTPETTVDLPQGHHRNR